MNLDSKIILENLFHIFRISNLKFIIEDLVIVMESFLGEALDQRFIIRRDPFTRHIPLQGVCNRRAPGATSPPTLNLL